MNIKKTLILILLTATTGRLSNLRAMDLELIGQSEYSRELCTVKYHFNKDGIISNLQLEGPVKTFQIIDDNGAAGYGPSFDLDDAGLIDQFNEIDFDMNRAILWDYKSVISKSDSGLKAKISLLINGPRTAPTRVKFKAKGKFSFVPVSSQEFDCHIDEVNQF